MKGSFIPIQTPSLRDQYNLIVKGKAIRLPKQNAQLLLNYIYEFERETRVTIEVSKDGTVIKKAI